VSLHHVRLKLIAWVHGQRIKKWWKNVRKACWLNLYHIENHGNCRSQYLIRPFWSPYFHKPHFTICTNCSTNLSTLGWFHEVVQWSINVFSHNSWNSPQKIVTWLHGEHFNWSAKPNEYHVQEYPHCCASTMAPILTTLIITQS